MKQRNLFLEILYAVLPAVSIACLLALWMGVSGNRPDLIPTPAETWSRFADTFDKPIMRLSFFGHILASLRRVMTALLISWSAGILFGILIGWSRTGKSVFGSIFNMLRPIPPLAWIPLITIWFHRSGHCKYTVRNGARGTALPGCGNSISRQFQAAFV